MIDTQHESLVHLADLLKEIPGRPIFRRASVGHADTIPRLGKLD
jgi:hypothetical protein